MKAIAVADVPRTPDRFTPAAASAWAAAGAVSGGSPFTNSTESRVWTAAPATPFPLATDNRIRSAGQGVVCSVVSSKVNSTGSGRYTDRSAASKSVGD
ncbi:hypothetical protein [Mycolicibacterium septicum]|uniref:hypothetical protein n=1 Tax=Mycolicibacterium septicum TaxID=98668 RepID=UPI001FCC51D9|nr:hypothetical protein [Mycolicibacterium septicum]